MSVKEGKWIIIQNCYLMKNSFKYFDSLLNKVSTASQVHQQFKLWIVTYPYEEFPVTTLLKGT